MDQIAVYSASSAILKIPRREQHFTTDRNNNLHLHAEMREEERKKEKKLRGKSPFKRKARAIKYRCKSYPGIYDRSFLSFFSDGEREAQERAQQGSASVAVSRQTVSNRVVSRCLYVRGSELRGHRRRVTSAIKLRSIDVPFGARDGNVTVLCLLSPSRLPLQSYPRFLPETNYILFFFDYGIDDLVGVAEVSPRYPAAVRER